MIAVSSSGRSFRALAAYLVRGRDGDSPERVAWSTARNLPTSDPELAAVFMRATASQSARIEKPVYHVALSFDPNDRVGREAMERVADRVLERLGLREHQAVIVAHGDRSHPHVHLFVNRVHPETGHAWERWKDRPVIQEVLREEEVALGLRRVTSSLEPPAAQGLAPASDPGRLTPLTASLESTRAPDRAEPASGVQTLSEDLTLYGRIQELISRRLDLEREADVLARRADRLESAVERVSTAREQIDHALRSTFRDPAMARTALEGVADAQGVAAAIVVLRTQPERLGELLAEERSRTLGFGRRLDDRAAREVAERATGKASELLVARTELRNVLGPPPSQQTDRAPVADAPSLTPRGAAIERNRLDDHLQRARDQLRGSRDALAALTEEQRQLRQALRSLPAKTDLEKRIATTADRLTPRQLQSATRSLSPPHLALLGHIRNAVRDVVLGFEEERRA